MNDLIELKEQTFCSVYLTQAEAWELKGLRMDVIAESARVEAGDKDDREPFETTSRDNDETEPGCQVYSVNSCCRVGHFRLVNGNRRTVRIEPKVGISNVFSLLGAAYSFYAGDSPFRSESVDYAIDKTKVLEPLVRHFNSLLKLLLQDGLLTNYIEQEENLKALRGRVVFAKHLSQNLIRQDRLYCRFFRSEVDIPENQLIAWTLVLLTRLGEWSQGVRQILQSHILHFGGVSIRAFLPRQYPTFHYDRLTSRYAEVHSWCKLFVDLLSVSDKPGETTFNGYLLDMNVLFERFVISTFKSAREVVPAFSLAPHETFDLDVDKKLGICPDLTMRSTGDSIVTVDVKYKRTGGAGQANHPDLYQVISYSTALGLIGQKSVSAQGILVYPVAEHSAELDGCLRIITSKERSSELSIRVVRLDLGCEDPVGDAQLKLIRLLEEISI
jgi:5-methylcytosine-specific restriction endonuclease McrBC regulatory subunit McrC